METIETCLSHITLNCPNPTTRNGATCTADEQNKDCPYYHPAKLKTFEVIDPSKKPQLYDNNL